MNEQNLSKKKGNKVWAASVIAFIAGSIVSTAVMFVTMPSLMLKTAESTLGFNETVEKIQERIEQNGWVVSTVMDMNKSLSNHNVQFEPKVKLIKLCHPEYAKSVLESDRDISVMMPCTFSVWEDDAGKIFITRMNMKLMAKMFGGNVNRVMGGSVSHDEELILEGLLKD